MKRGELSQKQQPVSVQSELIVETETEKGVCVYVCVCDSTKNMHAHTRTHSADIMHRNVLQLSNHIVFNLNHSLQV